MRITRSVTISLPPEQLKRAERLAKKQSRTMSELFREGLRRLEQDEERRPKPGTLAEFARLVSAIQEDARRTGLDKISAREIDAEVSAVRKSRPKAQSSTSRSRK